MSRDDAASRIAAHFDSRFLRGYASSKLRTDPVYVAALETLRTSRHPLFDIGCGVGLLPFYLREHGFSHPIVGIDHDAKKVNAARAVGSRYANVSFEEADIRRDFPTGMNISALDVMHYFREEEQEKILRRIAAAIPPGGVAIFRDAVRDGSLRYRLTAAQEAFSRSIRWLKAERLNFLTREQMVEPFDSLGFSVEVRPLWGRTPFNNYFFVFRRPESGSTNA